MAAYLLAARPIPQSRLSAIDNPEAVVKTTTQSDDSLVESAKIGDTDAFAQLIERYQRFCFSKAYSIVRNHGDAEDEVQIAWIQVWTHLGSYRGQRSFGGWLGRIVSNRCLLRLRRARLAPMMS